ncbi:MAG: UrcA family protein [Pseudomonadota bacterium]
MTMIKTIAATLAFTLAITAPGASALAGTRAGEAPSVSVSYADLNLSSEKGREVLDRRIERAIEKVCGRKRGKITLDTGIYACERKTRPAAYKARDLAVASYGENRLAGGPDKVIRLAAQ